MSKLELRKQADNHIAEEMVGMGEIKLANSSEILWTVLGSCIGLVLYDPIEKIGGIAHVMLQKNERNDKNIGKYADTAVPELIRRMLKRGSKKRNLKAFVVGGANMFKWKSPNGRMDIGTSNSEIVKEILLGEGITIAKSSTGGNTGYKVKFSPSDGVVRVRFTDGRKIELKVSN
jgi:chemotaxis protein CheD